VDSEGTTQMRDNTLRRDFDPLARILHDSPDLARLVSAWPDLPLPIRSAMLTLLASVDPKR
jgi:hypothetical protein